MQHEAHLKAPKSRSIDLRGGEYTSLDLDFENHRLSWTVSRGPWTRISNATCAIKSSEDPLTTPCGHVFCSGAACCPGSFEQLPVKYQRISPRADRHALKNLILTGDPCDNHARRDAVVKLQHLSSTQRMCDYSRRSVGIKDATRNYVNLRDMDAHMETCDYRPVGICEAAAD
ncbi:E3 ubiquitin-protein ligase PDZRN3 isoform X1 [Lates japonicus]|uniref:E3 ubiquitin-protein ligase PDZRN3 isoform X1 n=1 Tax=Lates japonicus TaxID=270547 RepID=A0AAD3N858_LATJO|nr:E3 ubiquitin-protein ligase PDZRN3 isoform X1 [Lates japonicus]